MSDEAKGAIVLLELCFDNNIVILISHLCDLLIEC